MPLVLDDADLQRLLPMERALSLVRDALVAHAHGDLIAPARVAADVGGPRLTFTCGAVRGQWVGFRSYLAPGDAEDEQVVVIQDGCGRVTAVYAGQDLGPRRTGAIGGVAVDALAPSGEVTVGLLGSGRQAWQQVVALATIRGVRELRVWSPNPDHRRALAGRAGAELGLDARAAAGPRDAVEGMSVVVLATGSATPVVEVAWLAEAAVVSTLGPKQVGRHEFPVELAELGGPLLTDSVAQVHAYDPPFVLAGSAAMDRLVTLGSWLVERDQDEGVMSAPGPRPGAPAVFLSVGLAGTEAFLLHAVTGAERDRGT